MVHHIKQPHNRILPANQSRIASGRAPACAKIPATPTPMKAVRIESAGLGSLVDLPMPRLGHAELLVRVAAVGVCLSDVELWEGSRPPDYVRYPVTPGHEWSGTVAEVGRDAAGFAVNDRVTVEGHNYCKACFYCQRGDTNLCIKYNELGFTLPGAYAEYVAVRADLAHKFGADLPFEAAALTEPSSCVANGLLRAQIQPGDTVVVVGPGTIGLLAVAWARQLGAANVLAVGLNNDNAQLASQMGATHYAASTAEAAELVASLTDQRGADTAIEAAGSTAAFTLAANLARRGGTLVTIGITGGTAPLALPADILCLKDLRVHGVFAYTAAHFKHTLRAIESRTLKVAPLITHRLPLASFREAFRLLREKSERVGKIVLEPHP